MVLRRNVHLRIWFLYLQTVFFWLVGQVVIFFFNTTVLPRDLALSSDSRKAPRVHICNILSACKLSWEALKPIYRKHELVVKVLLPFLVKAYALIKDALIIGSAVDIEKGPTDLKHYMRVNFEL